MKKDGFSSFPAKGSFWYFFIMFFMLAFIPAVLLGCWFFYYRVQTHRRDIVSAYEERIDRISTELEYEIQTLDAFASMQAVNPLISRITCMTAPVISSRVKASELTSYAEHLRVMSLQNSLIYDAAVLFNSKDYAICSEGGSTARRFIENLYLTDYDYDDIYSLSMAMNNAVTLYSSDMSMRRLTYEGTSLGAMLLRVYHIYAHPKGDTILIAYIPLDYVERYIKRHFDFEGIYLSVSGVDGTPYFEMGGKPADGILFSPRVVRGMFVLNAEIPDGILWNETRDIVLLTAAAAIFMLFLLISASYTLSTRQINQLRAFLSLGGAGAKKNLDYLQLEALIASLVSSEEHLRLENERVVPVLRDEVLRRLLFGVAELKLIEAGIKYFSFPFSCFTVCLVHPSPVSHDFKLEETRVKVHCLETDSDILAVIFNHERETDMGESIEGLSAALAFRDAHPAVFAGMPVAGIDRISESYENAKSSMEYRSGAELRVLDEDGAETRFYYPINLETRIINAMNAYSFNDVVLCIDEIFNKNEKEELVSKSALRLLAVSLTYTAYRAVNLNKGISAPTIRIKEINAIETLEEARGYAHGVFSIAISRLRDEQESDSAGLEGRVTGFIRDNYNNPDMSLTMLSLFVNRPEYELSRLIKKWHDTNFLDMVQHLRINEACKMIAKGANLKDIAAETGFLSDATFRRTFKKIIGVSPGEYRKAAE